MGWGAAGAALGNGCLNDSLMVFDNWSHITRFGRGALPILASCLIRSDSMHTPPGQRGMRKPEPSRPYLDLTAFSESILNLKTVLHIPN
jgi:hypothetical protein